MYAGDDWVMCETGFYNCLAYSRTSRPEFINAKPESCNHFSLICVDSTDGRAHPHWAQVETPASWSELLEQMKNIDIQTTIYTGGLSMQEPSV